MRALPHPPTHPPVLQKLPQNKTFGLKNTNSEKEIRLSFLHLSLWVVGRVAGALKKTKHANKV